MRSWHAALCLHLSWYLQARTGIDDLWLGADYDELVRSVLLLLMVTYRACPAHPLLLYPIQLLR